MANKNTTTKKEFFAAIQTIMEQNPELSAKIGERDVTAAAIAEFCGKEINTLSSKTKKKSEADIAADAAMREVIMATLESADRAMTVSEVLNANLSDWTDLVGEIPSNQKLTRKLNDMVTDGILEKNTIKGRSYFSIK